MLGGDPSEIRRAAAQAERLAAEVWQEAAAMSGAATGRWHGRAGERYRAVLAQRSDDVRRVAERYDQVAADLHTLARTLEERQQAVLAAFEAARREFKEAAEGAVDAVRDGAARVWEHADDLGGFVRDREWPW